MPVGVTHPVSSGVWQFVDYSRITDAYGWFSGWPYRELRTTAWWPTDSRGPFPLVVFAPGYAVNGDFYASLLSRIAAAGYIVIAPELPLLSGYPAGPTEAVGWDQLYGDLSFAASAAVGDPGLGPLIDPDRIAVAGHSDGAAISFGDGFGAGHADGRFRAVISYAADVSYYDPYVANGRPFLHILSDYDEYNPYGQAIGWDRAVLQQPRTIVSLWNASHAEPFTSPFDAHFGVVTRMTIGFLDAHLKGHPEELANAGAEINTLFPSLGWVE
jgi:dienelactone hydrolase